VTSPIASIGGGVERTSDPRAQLREAAKAFEAVFARQMIGSMRQSSLGDDLFGSQAADQFREMSDARMADDMAAKGALGIAEMLIKQFEGAAAAAPKPEPSE